MYVYVYIYVYVTYLFSFLQTYCYFAKETRRPSGLGHFISFTFQVSLLAGIDISSVVRSLVVNRAYNSELFNFAFRSFFLDSIGSFANHEPRSIVVVDNCTIHNEDLIQMVRGKGGVVLHRS